VCLEALGPEPGRPYVERAQPEHPSLVDPAHLVDERFGITNIPNSVWIDEQGTIVRPAEPAWPVVRERREPAAPPPELPSRQAEMMNEASKIVSDAAAYLAALHDWVDRGAESRFALSPDEVIARSQPRSQDGAAAAAHFELAHHLHARGDLGGARAHFREAHRLQPQNWTYRRQAWSMEPGGFEGPLARFWQGPTPGAESEWPYEGDWISDTKAIGAENYYPRFVP
jgi:hypothetical protein